MPDLSFEIMIPGNKVEYLPPVKGLRKAQDLVCYLMKRQYRAAKRERFVPQLITEAKAAYKQLEEKANAERKEAGKPTRG